MNSFLKQWKKYFLFIGVLSCFINILQLTFAFYMFAIYQSIISSYNETSLYTITIVALYALVCLVFFNYLRTRILYKAGVSLNRRLGDTVFKHMLKSRSYAGAGGYHQGVEDLNTVSGYFGNAGIHALFDVPWAPLYLMLIYFFHPILGLTATTGAIIIFSLSILQDRLAGGPIMAANFKNIQNRRLADTVLRNAEVVTAMGMENNVSSRWDAANADVISNQTVASQYAGVVQSVTRPMQVFMQVLMFCFGAYFVLVGQLEAGMIVASSIIMGQAVGPVMRAMGAWRFTLQAKQAYDRLSAFLMKVENQPRKMSLPAPEGRLEACKLYFKAGPDYLLNDISFNLQPGEIMGLIGPSGAGKSTLCRIITGIWPAWGNGDVRLDGVDMFYWEQDELGGHVGYLPQDIVLFETSVAGNIARMGEVDPRLVEQAARSINIHEWIESLPQGYETPLNTTGGIILSGGQRQLIGLARAVYGNPALLVLDEPNSNLDMAGDRIILQLLTHIRRQRSATVVIVSHKPEVLEVTDQILALKDGRVAAFGPKDQVLDRLRGVRQLQKKA